MKIMNILDVMCIHAITVLRRTHYIYGADSGTN